MIHDRAASDEFPFTHRYLADMLGIQRQTATVTLQRLETAKHSIRAGQNQDGESQRIGSRVVRMLLVAQMGTGTGSVEGNV